MTDQAVISADVSETNPPPDATDFFCVECGYDLEGHHGADASAVCPECGTPIAASVIAPMMEEFRALDVQRIARWTRVLLFIHAGLIAALIVSVWTPQKGVVQFLCIAMVVAALLSIVPTRQFLRPPRILSRTQSQRTRAARYGYLPLLVVVGAIVALGALRWPYRDDLWAAGCAVLLICWLPSAVATFARLSAVCFLLGFTKLAKASHVVAFAMPATLVWPIIFALRLPSVKYGFSELTLTINGSFGLLFLAAYAVGLIALLVFTAKAPRAPR